MSSTSSKFWSIIRKPFLKPASAINTKIMNGDANYVAGSPENPSAAPKEGANFRQVGSVPEDKSGFKVC